MKRISLFSVFLIIIGVIAFSFGCKNMFFRSNEYVETAAVIEQIEEFDVGTVEEQERDYDVYVAYTVDGVTYHEELGYFAPDYEEGKEITIYYNPNDPTDIHGEDKGVIIYMMIIGPVLVVIGIIMFLRRRG